jgi:sucrose-6-phosphate hydrolase SacC (GH32 family)
VAPGPDGRGVPPSRTAWLLALLLLVPGNSHALEHPWGSGSTGRPTFLSVTVRHEGSPLQITATGSSLANVTSATVLTPDPTWTIPLTIQARTGESITAVGTMPRALQGSSLLLSSGTASVGLSPLPDDPIARPPETDGWQTYPLPLEDPDTPHVRPKDFAFIYNTVYMPPPMGLGWEGVYHVFYIRHFDTIADDDQNEKSFAHAWWRPGTKVWRVDTTAFRCAGAPWDSLHVWAPSIVFRGGQYVMYYTGVDRSGNQRIGYATTPVIDTSDTKDGDWQRQFSPIFAADSAGWTRKAAPQQCRDPYVMANPDGAGLIMVYAATDSATGAMAVGLARSFSGLGGWTDEGHYAVTDSTHSHARRVESPHIFADSTSEAAAFNKAIPLGQVRDVTGRNVTWRIMFSDGDYVDTHRSTIFVTDGSAALTDTSLAAWSQPGPTSLFSYATQGPQGPPGLEGLQGTECLRAGNEYVLAGFQLLGGTPKHFGIRFRRMYWSWPNGPSADFALSSGGADTAVPGTQGQSGDLRFQVAGLVPARGLVRFRIEAPRAMKARVVVYDVMGRVVKRILDQAVPSGVSYLWWDGRGETGQAVSGIYFARLSGDGGNRVVRVSLVR